MSRKDTFHMSNQVMDARTSVCVCVWGEGRGRMLLSVVVTGEPRSPPGPGASFPLSR